jgi:NOL1/NOP2/sun family putative RNA methylase
LPRHFLERMRPILNDDFPAFKLALEGARTNAIRVNTSKLEPLELEGLLGLTLERVPWSASGLYVPFEARLGAHALHHAGAYYVQEASAQAVALALAPRPGERVLDLCAAPGGKSTHLAQLMANQGLLVCNEVSASRARVLAENLERLGCVGVVTNEEPATLARRWGGYFDRVLVDAPCSGEGMFRKNLEAVRDWSEGNVLACARRQSEILESAATLLKPGGVLVYSTCTFALEENEAVIAALLETHAEFTLESIAGFEPGLNGVGVRLWPHRLRGEGHFLARLRKLEGERTSRSSLEDDLPRARGKLWAAFEAEFLENFSPVFEFRGELQSAHPETPSLEGIRALRVGVPVAMMQKDRLEPHHALSHFYPRGVKRAALELDLSDPRVAAFLRGESLESDGDAGWTLVRVAELALGWGKRVGRTVKNHYPKHLRGRVSAVED